MKKLISKIKNKVLPPPYGWFGNYPTWEAANDASVGYDSSAILNKVRDASLKVKNGEAAFERDSILFYEHEYSWPLVSGLLWVAAQKHGALNVMDFGGSLGSTYFQYKKWLDSLATVNWCIVEQSNFVKAGNEHFADDQLKFYLDMESCINSQQIDIFFSGCSLPYLKEPYKVLEQTFKYHIPFLLLDRMPFIDHTEDRLTVQKVPPEIYNASYPAWFFSYKKFTAFLKNHYSIVAEYDCADRANIPSSYKGLILKHH